ncbi:MAG: hypothetical protein HY709_04730 [Candidatus Latescibacteria bacterium]|nr:hypothetical protein [Candidatus Latescibacterota bacterium]
MRPYLRRATWKIWLIVDILIIPWIAYTQEIPLSPPEGLTAFDMPNDTGGSIALVWNRMSYDRQGVEYSVLLAERPDGPFDVEGGRFASTEKFASENDWPFWAWEKGDDRHFVEVSSYTDPKTGQDVQLSSGKPYYLTLRVTDGTTTVESPVVSAIPEGDFFNWVKLNNFIFMILFSGIILGFIARARRKDLFLRRIPGLNAVEEAVGRATEMGKPIYFLTGRLGMSSISTIAATIILGEIAKKVAAYDTTLRVPHTDPIVMAVCQEIVHEAYIEAGRPDAYRDEINFFVTDEQFSYTASVDGMMLRERPAACFYMGFYYAESLLLAETGAGIGAIQIAGTDTEHQLPFFVVACDYTLIGEELYAATAYLSREPVLVGTLRGQDVGKVVMMAASLVGVLLATIGTLFEARWVTYILELFEDFS